MITYGVCLYRPEVYGRVCEPALLKQKEKYDAEIILEMHDTSIFAAYEAIRRRASHETIVYLHDDVELLDEDTTPRILNILDGTGAGVMGVVGAVGRKLPWWRNEEIEGCWVRQAKEGGEKIYRQNWTETPYKPGMRAPRDWAHVDLLDGLLLADRLHLPWPVWEEGWHGYDVWLSQQCHPIGPIVGDVMVCHHNQEHDREWGAALRPAMERWAEEFPWLQVQARG